MTALFARFLPRRLGPIPGAGLLALLTLLAAASSQALEIDLGFSSEKSGELPARTHEREFTCSDTIYALIDIHGLAPGTHDIELHWLDPKGNRQELTRFGVYAEQQTTVVWAWMRLHYPEGSGIARIFDSSHGMGDFIGSWTVRFIIDGRREASGQFEVLC